MYRISSYLKYSLFWTKNRKTYFIYKKERNDGESWPKNDIIGILAKLSMSISPKILK